MLLNVSNIAKFYISNLAYLSLTRYKTTRTCGAFKLYGKHCEVNSKLRAQLLKGKDPRSRHGQHVRIIGLL